MKTETEILGKAMIGFDGMVPKYPENENVILKYIDEGYIPCVCTNCKSIIPLDEEGIIFYFKNTEDFNYNESLGNKLVIVSKNNCMVCTKKEISPSFDFDLVKKENLGKF